MVPLVQGGRVKLISMNVILCLVWTEDRVSICRVDSPASVQRATPETHVNSRVSRSWL